MQHYASRPLGSGFSAAGRNPDEGAKKLLDEGLDQSKKLEADRLGVAFVASVGYDPQTYVARHSAYARSEVMIGPF